MIYLKKIVPWYRLAAILFCMFFFPGIQGQNTISIKASATVVEATGIELITLKDISIDEASAANGILNISPVTDETAGKMLVKGKINSTVRLSYLNQLSLVNTSGEGTLLFKYIVSGNATDNQRASQLLDQVERIVQFNDKGQYYLWLGGQVDLTRAKPGSYTGEFTIQIEYI